MSDWTKFKVTELKAELKRRGLAQTGLKAELVARLVAADDESATPQQQAQNDEQSASPNNDRRELSSDETVEPDPAEPLQDAKPVELDTSKTSELPSPEPEPKLSPAGNEYDSVTTAKKETETALESPSQLDDNTRDARGAQNDQGQSHVAHSPSTSDPAIADSVVPTAATGASPVPSSNKNGHVAEAMEPDITVDAFKRKRRSASPTPKEDSVKRRRAQENAQDAANEPVAQIGRGQDGQGEDISMSDGAARDKRAQETAPAAASEESRIDDELSTAEATPAIHRSTPALYINNLMRPLREIDLQTYLVGLAAPSHAAEIDDVIRRFYLDTIRTHAFVVFDSISMAVRVRNGLHGQVWPKESNRKALFVDFVPADKVEPWIKVEEYTREKRTGLRWEVVYQPSGNGDDVEALQQSNSITSSSSAAQPMGRGTAPPTGIEGAPAGPRGYRPSAAQSSRHARPLPPDSIDPRDSRLGQPIPREQPRPGGVDWGGERTATQPAVYFEAVPVTLARRRLQDMRSFYTRDAMRPVGREINRYSFQDDDRFVDRGREVFEGIRPPHRQQAMDREMRGGGGGGRFPRRGSPAPYRPRGDRYVPGSGEPEDDRVSRHGEDDERRWWL